MTNRLNNPKSILVINKSHYLYLFFGLATFLIYYTLTWLFYSVFNASYQLAMGAAYIIALVFHFYANKFFTFNAAASPVTKNLLRYTVLATVNYLIQLAIVALLFDFLFVNFYISALVATAFITVFSYLVLKFWVFGRGEHDYC